MKTKKSIGTALSEVIENKFAVKGIVASNIKDAERKAISAKSEYAGMAFQIHEANRQLEQLMAKFVDAEGAFRLSVASAARAMGIDPDSKTEKWAFDSDAMQFTKVE